MEWRHRLQSRVIVSFRFSSARQTAVQAASSAASTSFGSGARPIFDQLRRGLRVGLVARPGSSPAASAAPPSRRRPGARHVAWRKRERERARRRPRRPRSSVPLGEDAGRLDERRVVEQHERRQRRVRPRPLGRAFLAGRGVERLEHRVQVLPLPVDVDAAPPLLRVRVGRVLALREVQVPVEAGRLVRLRARAADLQDEQPADGEGVVADRSRPAAASDLAGRAGGSPGRVPAAPAISSEDCRYARLVTISFTMCLTSQPLSTNSTAR